MTILLTCRRCKEQGRSLTNSTGSARPLNLTRPGATSI